MARSSADPGVSTSTRTVQGAGVDLVVHESGDPSWPAVLLVHGFPDTSAVWRPVAERLSGEFHVITYDVRGAGASGVPAGRSGYALPLLVADMKAVAAATSPGAAVHLVGHDWGSIQGWEAVTTDDMRGRVASYTSISAPPIDHVSVWVRNRLRRGSGDLRSALRQAVHSWYIGFFRIPRIPEWFARTMANSELWTEALHRVESVPTDEAWPAPTFSTDFEHGVELYRANIASRLRRPENRHTDVPVQLIVPRQDRYVTPALLDGLETWATTLWRRDVEGGHWIIRSNPGDVAEWVRELIRFAADGTESPDLARWRVMTARTSARG